eukprot:TCONS_00000426-protein
MATINKDSEEASEKPVNKILNAHRPLQPCKSAAGRLQDEKYKSTNDMVKSSSELSVNDIMPRRRSRSAPLTLEASIVATELTRLSDALATKYTLQKVSVLNRIRRHTLASPSEREHDRRSFHFDYHNYQNLQIENLTIEEGEETPPEYQRGTSV